MYASNKESFVFQAVTVLESMGLGHPQSQIICAGLQAVGSEIRGSNDPVTDEWARDFMRHVWDRVR